MNITPIFPRFANRAALRTAGTALLLAGLVALIMVLTLNVRSRLAAMERANSDDGQWVMMQTEVEALRLKNAITSVIAGRGPLSETKRWFDVLYLRVDLLTSSPLYRGFVSQPENSHNLRQVQAFVDRWLPIMDGPEPALLAALPVMEAEVTDVHRNARSLSLAALVDFTQSTVRTRAKLSQTLILLALTTGATILILGLLALMLLRISRIAQREAAENQTTGARLSLIIATSPDAIVVTNRGGWVVAFNPAAEAMFGVSRGDILGRVASEVIFASEHLAAYQAVISDAIGKAVAIGPQRLEVEGVRADGIRFPLEVSIAVRDLNPGALVVCFLRDISARKASNAALQDALTQARAGEKAKASFIAVMSHEMRTPLNGLLGAVGLLRDTALDPDQRDLLRVMQVSGEVLLGHVNAVLDVSVAEAAESTAQHPFDLDQVIDDCTANQISLAQKAGSVLTHAPLTGAFGHVIGDAGRLRQVLLNLIGNAVKFTRNGKITVETERLPQVGPDAGWVEIRVIDTGIGIADQDLDRVFQDFETVNPRNGRDAGGTGLGLGISRRLVEAMGGEIGVESEIGQGSVFWLRLRLPPVSVAARAARSDLPSLGANPKAISDGAAPLSGLAILIIEDNDINRFVLRRYLEIAGHHVTEAVDGLDGVAQADAQAFDLIITDIAMPGLDGIAATGRIRSGGGASAKARILALTAHALPEQKAQFTAAGIDACLTKPVARGVLLAHVAGTARADPALGQHATADVLDTAVLAGLHATLDPSVVDTLITRMIAEGDRVIPILAQGSNEPDQNARLAHQFAGGCATFGAARLRLALIAFETAPKAEAVARAALPALWTETRTALQQGIARTKT